MDSVHEVISSLLYPARAPIDRHLSLHSGEAGAHGRGNLWGTLESPCLKTTGYIIVKKCDSKVLVCCVGLRDDGVMVAELWPVNCCLLTDDGLGHLLCWAALLLDDACFVLDRRVQTCVPGPHWWAARML